MLEMNFGYINQSLQKEWEDLVKTNPATGYMQSFFWVRFKNTLGWTTFKIGIFENNKLIGGAIVAKFPFPDKNILYIPEGPVLPYDQAWAEEMFDKLMQEIDKIANLTGEKLTSHLRIEPKLVTLPSFFKRFQKAPVDQQPLRTLVINLKDTEEKILQQMKAKGRYNIKVALKNGVEIFQTDVESGLNDFWKLYKKTVERNSFEGKDKGYFERLVYALSEENYGRFFFTKYKGKILAAALVIFYGDTATFLFGASDDTNRQLMTPYLLHWEIIKSAKKSGLKWYDFYGISPDENDLSHPWQGFTVFKKKFGGEEILYTGAYDFVYNQSLYQQYLKED